MCTDTLIALGQQQSSETGSSSTTDGSLVILTPAHGFSSASAGHSPPVAPSGGKTWSVDGTPIDTRGRSLSGASPSAADDVPGSADSRHAEAKAINKSDATMSASSLLERDQSGSAAAPVFDGFSMGQTLLEPCPCDGPSTVLTTALDPSSSALSNASERKIVTEQGRNKVKSVQRVGPCLRCRTYGEPVC